MTTPSDPRRVIEILLAALINSRGAFECPVCNRGDRGLACDDGHADDCWLAEAMGSDDVDEAIWLDALFGNGDRDDPSELDGPMPSGRASIDVHEVKPARWGILDVMGQQRWGGLISEVHELGQSWIEVETPEVHVKAEVRVRHNGPVCIPEHTRPAWRRLFGPDARYALTFTSERTAREHLHDDEDFRRPASIPLPDPSEGQHVVDDEGRRFHVVGLYDENDRKYVVVDAEGGSTARLWLRDIRAIYDADRRHVWGEDLDREPPSSTTEDDDDIPF